MHVTYETGSIMVTTVNALSATTPTPCIPHTPTSPIISTDGAFIATLLDVYVMMETSAQILRKSHQRLTSTKAKQARPERTAKKRLVLQDIALCSSYGH